MPAPERRPARSLALLFSIFITAAAPVVSAADGALTFDQKFLGLIDSVFDADLIEIGDVAGSPLSVTVTSNAGNKLDPGLELLDESMTLVETGAALKLSDKKARLVKFELPASGTYFLRVTSANSLTGTYKVKVKGSPPKKWKGADVIGAPGEIDEIEFAARADSVLKGTVTRSGGDVQPFGIELVGPGGTLVAIAGGLSTEDDGAVLALDGIELPALGDYRLRITGKSGTTGEYAWNLKVVPPKPAKGKVYEDGHPQDDGGAPDGFTLEDVSFGRGLRTLDGLGMDVVSPYSLVRTDPISDLPIPGTLQSLFAGGDLAQLASFQLGPVYGPPIVPRNGVIVLRFSKKPDLDSLQLDAEGRTTAESPVRVRVSGVDVMLQVFRVGHELILNPAFDDQVGLPPGPVAFDAAGNPSAGLVGVGQLEIVRTGPFPLMSVTGSTYEARKDLLGSPDAGGVPIDFNPGNQVLDFFEQSTVGVGGKGYGGFLPDEFAPRLIRELAFQDSYDPDFANPATGDLLGADFLSLVLTKPFDDTSKGGQGEWAGGLLRLRPGGPLTETVVITRNTVLALPDGRFRNDLLLATTIVIPPAVGEAVELVRAEYFEPDPNHPIDPELFDPQSPEVDANADLLNFVEVRDRDGAVIDVGSPIDALASFTFRFSEPMLVDSFRPYETLFVSEDIPPDDFEQDFGLNFVGVVDASEGGKAMTFKPYRRVQFGVQAGIDRPVGFGEEARPLRIHLKVVPPADVLEGLLGPNGYDDFEAEGHRGVTDLGGQPLAFPLSFLSQDQPFVDYSLPFATAGDASLSDTGAVVQRFVGRPVTGFDASGNAGVAYRDVPPELCANGNNFYGPRIADLNLFTNGFLSGAPVQFFTKIHDDFNPPIDIAGNETPMNPFPFGTATPIGGFAVLGGARMQHVYRAVDASPDWEALAGTNLDLVRLSYAPIGGSVTNTVLPDISIHAGHSAIVPDTRQAGGIPSHPGSGLVGKMDDNYDAVESVGGTPHQRQLVLGDVNPAGGFVGAQFPISNSLLFKPIGTQHTYHPFPDFTAPFAYNNGTLDQATFTAPKYGNTPTTWGGAKGDRRPESLLLEYRVRVVDAQNPPATQNGFTFAVGVLSSALPRFRVYSIGTGCLACCFAGNCATGCLISFGPPMDGLAGNGGPPLEPDNITDAAGPAPAPPGLPCYCLRPPANPTPLPMNCADQTTAAPTIDQVAYGNATNPTTGNQANNFGDNSRYFMVFDYVKRESYLRSPFIRVQPEAVADPQFLAPSFDPPLDTLPAGTTFALRFRASPSGGLMGLDATPWVTPEELSVPGNALNQMAGTPYIQFEAAVTANTSTQLTPVIDEIVVPFRHQ